MPYCSRLPPPPPPVTLSQDVWPLTHRPALGKRPVPTRSVHFHEAQVGLPEPHQAGTHTFSRPPSLRRVLTQE